jgi:prepilin-type N-terminal cleavage/methylation domain-containing protein
MRRAERGLTLIEILISTTLFSIVFAGVYLLYVTMQGMMARGELMTDLQQNVRVGLDKMVQEIRMAGYDPEGAIPLVTLAPQGAIRAASATCFSFVGLGLDRSTNPATEKSKQITYSLSGTTMGRQVDSWDSTAKAFSGGTAQPQAEVVNSLTFIYYSSGNEILVPHAFSSTQRCPPAAGVPAQSLVQLDLLQMQRVKRVVVRIQTKDSRPRVFAEFFTVSSDVFLRNL